MLNEQELTLVHAMQEAPRASWAQLASSLATDARTLARRYGQLRDAGLVRVMATAGPRLLERLLFAHLRLRAEPGEASRIADQVARWPQASNVRLTDGSYDVHALLVGTDHASLQRTALESLARLHSIQQVELNTVLRTGDLGRAARLDALSFQQRSGLRSGHDSRTRVAKNISLGLEDFDLIQLLLQDGRRETAKLASHLDRDPSVISRRLTRLHKDGFLDFIAMIPDTASSSPVRALLWCAIAPQEVPEMLRQTTTLPWIGLLTITTGRANVLVVANLTTRAHLPDAQAELATLCPSLRFLETQLSSHAVKLHMRRLTDDARLTDDVADPFWSLRHHLVQS